MNDLKQHYLTQLPDTARWVETRDLLSASTSSFIETKAGNGFVVWREDKELGSIVGEVDSSASLEAARACAELLAFPENIREVQAVLTEFRAEQAFLFEAPLDFPASTAHVCKTVDVADVVAMEHLPEALRKELSSLEQNTSMTAAFDNELPVAFAYIASKTETLWDVSIDTLATHRRQGYAASTVLALMNAMKAKGKTAVWGALQSNLASLGLARKLGFKEVDSLWVLSRHQE
ncbi:MAG: GNAT family N-acetyltransferase [Deinococcota bacterium]